MYKNFKMIIKRSYVFRVGHFKITAVFNSDTGELDTPYNGKRKSKERRSKGWCTRKFKEVYRKMANVTSMGL